MTDEPIIFELASSESDLPKIVDCFLSAIDESYISHSEMMYGRAVSEMEWAHNIRYQVELEFSKILVGPKLPSTSYEKKLLLSRCEGKIIGVGILGINRFTKPFYGVVEDIAIGREFRGRGAMSGLLSMMEGLLRTMDVRSLFLESGIRNSTAHRAFERRGFHVVSVTMMRSLND